MSKKNFGFTVACFAAFLAFVFIIVFTRDPYHSSPTANREIPPSLHRYRYSPIPEKAWSDLLQTRPEITGDVIPKFNKLQEGYNSVSGWQTSVPKFKQYQPKITVLHVEPGGEVEIPGGTRIKVSGAGYRIPKSTDFEPGGPTNKTSLFDPKTLLPIATIPGSSSGNRFYDRRHKQTPLLNLYLSIKGPANPLAIGNVQIFDSRTHAAVGIGSFSRYFDYVDLSGDLRIYHRTPITFVADIACGEFREWRFPVTDLPTTIETNEFRFKIIAALKTRDIIYQKGAIVYGSYSALRGYSPVSKSGNSWTLAQVRPIKLRQQFDIGMVDEEGEVRWTGGSDMQKQPFTTYTVSNTNRKQVKEVIVRFYPERCRFWFKTKGLPSTAKADNLFDVPIPELRSEYSMENKILDTVAGATEMQVTGSPRVTPSPTWQDTYLNITTRELMKLLESNLDNQNVKIDSKNHQIEIVDRVNWIERM